MEPLDVFTARDLRQRSGALFRDAEQGRLAVITKHGRPALLAIPFDERLLTHGVHRAVALSLFEAHQVSLRQGAKLAGVTLEEFLEEERQHRTAQVSVQIREGRDVADSV